MPSTPSKRSSARITHHLSLQSRPQRISLRSVIITIPIAPSTIRRRLPNSSAIKILRRSPRRIRLHTNRHRYIPIHIDNSHNRIRCRQPSLRRQYITRILNHTSRSQVTTHRRSTKKSQLNRMIINTDNRARRLVSLIKTAHRRRSKHLTSKPRLPTRLRTIRKTRTSIRRSRIKLVNIMNVSSNLTINGNHRTVTHFTWHRASRIGRIQVVISRRSKLHRPSSPYPPS